MRTTLLVALLACGCSSRAILASRHVAPHETAPVEGVSYYLPKKLVEMTVWGYEADVQTPETRDAADGRPPPAPSAMRYFATLDRERIVPDLRHQFVIQPRWDAASHDTVQVELTDEGLLTAVRGRAQDQRAEIVHNLAKLASLLIRGPAPMPAPMRGLSDADARLPRMIAHYSFDPVDPLAMEDLRARLRPLDIHLEVTRQSDCPTATSGADCCTTCRGTQPGIYYRLPIPYRVRVTPAGLYRPPGDRGASDAGVWEMLDQGLERTLLLPNEALCFYVPVDRRMFVTAETSMTFERGMLRSVTTDKPSELLGFVKIPVDVASTLLAIPSELLTIRIQQKTQEAKLAELEAETATNKNAMLEAELELLEAMRKYQQAKAGKDP